MIIFIKVGLNSTLNMTLKKKIFLRKYLIEV